jgi:hypothetical protein
MKTTKQLSSRMPWVFLLAMLMLPLAGSVQAQTNAAAPIDPSLTPWIGVWTIIDDQTADLTADRKSKAVVEIRPSADGKGLDISRKTPQQTDAKEAVIPDGVRRPVESKSCSGWQVAKWLPESGLIIGSSDYNCKESGSYTLSNLKMILSTDQMADILLIKTSGQTRLAVQHLAFDHELTSAGESMPNQLAVASRMAVSAPWDLGKVIKLAKEIDPLVVEAALLEKKTQLKLDPKSLRQMTSAKLPKEIIDLLIALALPDKFAIATNGKIAVKSYSPSTPESAINYPTNSICDFSDPFCSYWRGLYPWNYYWTYYSPFWYGYPIYINSPGGVGIGSGGSNTPPGAYSDGQLSATRGYVQITPRDTGHHAIPRGYATYSGNSQGYSSGAPPAYSGSYSAPSSSSGGNASSSGESAPSSGSSGSSGASASPSGYSSGSGSGQAVPRQ